MASTAEITKVAGGLAGSDADEGVPGKRVQLVHDIGADLKDHEQSTDFYVDPSDRPTFVRIRSVADLSQARKGESTVFVASLRRRHCRAIAGRIRDLHSLSETQSMVVATQPVLVDLKKLIARLQQTSKEANIREVLRQVRDTLMNGQWDRYAEAAVRDCVADLLSDLAEADEEVSLDVVLSAADRLESHGFVISGLGVFDEQRPE